MGVFKKVVKRVTHPRGTAKHAAKKAYGATPFGKTVSAMAAEKNKNKRA